MSGQITLGDVEGDFDPIQIPIRQFYGIEVNDFAVTVAKTALWIAESQMMKETEDVIHMSLNFLPLKSYANIVEGNALRMDWEDVVAKNELDYITGNPPFVGARMMSKEQKEDLLLVFGSKWKMPVISTTFLVGTKISRFYGRNKDLFCISINKFCMSR